MQALGRIAVRINGVTAPAVRNVQVSKAQMQKIHKFADGSKARSQGQAEYKFSLSCSLLEEQQQILALIIAAQGQGEVNVEYDLGAETYLLENCGFDTEDASSDSDGTADLNISGVATDRIKVQ